MRGKPTRKLYTEDDLKAHNKGKDYVAKEMARQESLSSYTPLDSTIPSHLNYLGKQEWNRITPLLQELPIAQHDLNLIENWCILYAQRRKIQRELENNGEVFYVFDEEGNMTGARKNPAFDMLMTIIKEQRMIANQLGLTINSRLQLTSGDAEVEEDQFMKLLKGG